MGGDKPAEYKQVTVLFADVVRSMDIATQVGEERLREIMTELFDRSGVIVERYGGMVDKFTGDGIMALFGAPTALEDHALRACLAALNIQEEAVRLADELSRDGTTLQIRVGLNSGRVIAGEIGSSARTYTAIGHEVGMAQRMESAAPPGGIMLSESTARLVEHATVLSDPEAVAIKGQDEAVLARRLVAVLPHHERSDPSTLVGRDWELSALTGIVGKSMAGKGCVVGVVGPPGIGKSRLIRETVAAARAMGAEIISVFCESHASDIPFHIVTQLLRMASGVEGLPDDAARSHLRTQVAGADETDIRLLEDLLGITQVDAGMAEVSADARRRRVTALVNATWLARDIPTVFVVEDVHWIDEVSESMLADAAAVVAQTPSAMLLSYRPEYRGSLARLPGSQTISLAPLDAPDAFALLSDLLGTDSSVGLLATEIAARADGNPFFAEEIVRDLVERGVLGGRRGAYVRLGETAEVAVPPTLQATIAARIDRLGADAKRTLSAAAVIGFRFGPDLLTELGVEPVLTDLIDAELVEQVRFTPPVEYQFRHPLVRTVAYEAQLKSARTEIHRRLAVLTEQHDPQAVDEKAALIAEHYEAAGDLHTAFDWHMRSATWAIARNLIAARTGWQRARQVADRLPPDDSERASMRIAPRTLLCASSWRVGGSVADTGFDELRELATAADDKLSLAVGMSGLLTSLSFHARYREAAQAALEYAELVEAIGDPTIIIAMSVGPLDTLGEAGYVSDALRMAQRVIDLANGDPVKGNLIVGSPLSIAHALRATYRCVLALPGWREDYDTAIAMAQAHDPACWVATLMYKVVGVANRALAPGSVALAQTAESLDYAEQSGDNGSLGSALFTHGMNLVQYGDPQREVGLELLQRVRDFALQERFSLTVVPVVDAEFARERVRVGDLDEAIELSRSAFDHLTCAGQMGWQPYCADVLVDLLTRRNGARDSAEVESVIDRLEAASPFSRSPLVEVAILRLRALLSCMRGDDAAYRQLVDRYFEKASAFGYEGHVALAREMLTVG